MDVCTVNVFVWTDSGCNTHEQTYKETGVKSQHTCPAFYNNKYKHKERLWKHSRCTILVIVFRTRGGLLILKRDTCYFSRSCTSTTLGGSRVTQWQSHHQLTFWMKNHDYLLTLTKKTTYKNKPWQSVFGIVRLGNSYGRQADSESCWSHSSFTCHRIITTLQHHEHEEPRWPRPSTWIPPLTCTLHTDRWALRNQVAAGEGKHVTPAYFPAC